MSGSPEDSRSKTRRENPERSLRPNLFVIFGVLVLIGIVSWFWYLIQHSRGVHVPVSDYVLLFTLVMFITTLSLVLILLVFRYLIKYYFEGRKTPPRARIKTKLIIAFIGFTLVPSILLFTIASLLITTSIDNWLNERIENSLHESLEVARVYYKNSELNALYYGRQISQQITEKKLLNEGNLDKLRELIHQ
jgi:two-component system nitrogen regulation sensor histidine kinase NtrY